MQQLNLDIMEYVENHILPRYADFGKSHGLSHVMRVIKNSIELARFTGADIDMAYVVAAYHDLGMNGPRAIHHLTGGKILASDARLKKWFSPERIVIMKEAVEDHRASASRQPRSIYGKIVAEADRALDTKLWIPNSPNRNKLKQIQTIIESKSMLREWFDMIYQQEVSKT